MTTTNHAPAPVQSGAGRPARKTSGRVRRRGAPGRGSRRAGIAFVLPYAVFLTAFGVVPVCYEFYQSFVITNPFGPNTIGVQNWNVVIHDYRLPTAVEHVAEYLVIWLPLLLLTVFSLTLLVHARKGRFGAVMRFAYYLPGAVTGAAAVLMWLIMLSPTYGPFRTVLNGLGVHTEAGIIGTGWLPILLAGMAIEAGAGGWIVILYGALQSIPDEVLEAARLDGASAWKQAVHIKLPMVRRYLAFIVITSFAGGTQLFVEPTMLYNADTSVTTTWSPNQLAYSYAAQQLSFGRASVMSLLLLAIGLAAAFYVIYRTKFYQAD